MKKQSRYNVLKDNALWIEPLVAKVIFDLLMFFAQTNLIYRLMNCKIMMINKTKISVKKLSTHKMPP